MTRSAMTPHPPWTAEEVEMADENENIVISSKVHTGVSYVIGPSGSTR